MTHVDDLRTRLERLFEAQGVRRSVWECGRLVENRCCLVRSGGTWVAGYVERGELDVQFSVESDEKALARFAEWVARIDAMAVRGERATSEWLKQRGTHRP